MTERRCDEVDYIQFLIAAQRVFTCTEAARCQPDQREAPAHDAFTRLLQRQPSDTAALWQEVAGLVQRDGGVLVLDDTTLDKPYARKMALVTRHWSGKHRRVVMGINLITLLWTDGLKRLPTDFRVSDKPWGGKTKNEHFQAMLRQAKERGLASRYVLCDSWYSGLENLKTIRGCGWHWLVRFKANRYVNPDRTGNVPIESVVIPPEGRVVHLKGYGMILVFRTVAKDGDVDSWGTSDLGMDEEGRKALGKQAWGTPPYHRGLKPCCGVEQAQVRLEKAQRGHLLLAIKAFVRLEASRLNTGVSWYEAKTRIVRTAIREYLAHPTMPSATTA